MKLKPTLSLILLALLALILQILVLSKLEIASVGPDLVFLVVVISSFYLPVKKAMFTNWFIGILKDITSNAGLGSFAFLFLLIGLGIFLLKEITTSGDLRIQLVIAFVACYLCHFLYGMSLVFAFNALSFWFVLAKGFFIAFYTSLIPLIILGAIYGMHLMALKIRPKRSR